jgi:hypothetical protein
MANYGIMRSMFASLALPLFLVGCDHGYREHADATATERSSPLGEDRTPKLPVDADKLWADYDRDVAAADEKYRDKWIEVTGTVSSVITDFTGDAVVRLAVPEAYLDTVDATMSRTETTPTTLLCEGLRVSLVCKGEGEFMRCPRLGDCTFAQPLREQAEKVPCHE